MVSQNAENEQRIEKHRLQRRDKGFQTVEEPWNIDKLKVNSETVVLLEDASNLLANGMFMYGATAEEALKKILSLANRCKTLIVVSISGLEDKGYNEETVRYIEGLNWLNEKLKIFAVRTIEMHCGEAVEVKEVIDKFQRT